MVVCKENIREYKWSPRGLCRILPNLFTKSFFNSKNMSANSSAIKTGKPYDSTRGASIGRNENSVATAPGGDANDFASFLGPLPPFSGRQRADEKFSRETWDMPDK